MAKKPSAYALRNERAKAEGYKSYYDKRVKEGQARGFSRSQAAGHATKNEKSISAVKKERERGLGGGVIPAKPKPPGKAEYKRKRDSTHPNGGTISVDMRPDQFEKYSNYISKGRYKTAKVYALAEVYGIPELAGIDWDEDFDYDDYEDWDDIPEYDDDYAAED